MTNKTLLPTYQRFVNGVPVSLFSRRSFRLREKYLIFLVFLTFGVVCFGAFFFLPDFQSGTSGVAYNSVYNVIQKIQEVAPDLLIPAPPHGVLGPQDPHGPGPYPNIIQVGLERPGNAVIEDIHHIKDKERLQAKIDEDYEQQKTLEKPEVISGVRSRGSSTLVPPVEVVDDTKYKIHVIPPAPSDKLPVTQGGEDPDPVIRKRRDKIKEVSDDLQSDLIS